MRKDVCFFNNNERCFFNNNVLDDRLANSQRERRAGVEARFRSHHQLDIYTFAKLTRSLTHERSERALE